MKSKNRDGRRLGLESLERRDPMAGNVWARVEYGVLHADADNLDNKVLIYQDSQCGPGEYWVDGTAVRTGAPDTLVNGSRTRLKFGGVTQGVQARTYGGRTNCSWEPSLV